MKKILPVFIFIFSIAHSFSQYAEIYPTNWWIGMKWNKVQLLIHGKSENFNNEKVSINYPGINIINIHKFENTKYLAVDITIAPSAKPGIVNIKFSDDAKTNTVKWELKQRRKGNGILYAQGVTSSDFIYLIMPDRFSNGDTSNDRIAGMRDQSLDRDSIFYR